MKRLMMIFAVAFAALFCAQAAFAQTLSTEVRKTAQRAPQKGNGAFGKPTNMAPWFAPFMPTDTAYAQREADGGKPCDANGYEVQHNSNWRCKIVSSKTTGLTYRVQAKRIFTVENGVPVLYVRFNGSNHVSLVEYMSPRAEQYALTNGYQLDKGTSTMVAMNAPPAVAQAPIDCKSKVTIENLSQRGSCTNGVQTAARPAPAPAPQVAQAPDCSKGNFFEKKACLAAAALGGAGVAIGAGVRP